MRRALSRGLWIAAVSFAGGGFFGSFPGGSAGGRALFSLPTAQAQAAATLHVKIDGLKGTEGVALIALYDSAESWLKVPKALQVVRSKITGSALGAEFKGVKPGTYAVSVIHDENKNNELDMRWLPYPKPKEGSGASGDADAKVGPPKWESAKFDLPAEGATISVTVKYP